MKKILIIALAVFTAMLAHAESGTTEAFATAPINMVTNDFGDHKYTIINIKQGGIILKSDLPWIKAGSTFVSECIGVSTSDNKGSQLDGTCLNTDSDGDKYKNTFSRTNNSGQMNPGTQIYTGLTGKYRGVTGTCTYENKAQILNSVVYGFNTVKCDVSK
jgi:hypothetical protein